MTAQTRTALLSVSDKRGIEDFARALHERGWEIVSTGGTADAVRNAGIPVTSVDALTGHPEMMDGRVKTLHPAVHAGLLARRDNDADLAALAAQGYRTIDLVAVNLYPFRETVANPEVTVSQGMAKVDIGGPTMIRAAAKNHADVWVVVDPEDYTEVVAALDTEDEQLRIRRELAAKVFEHVSAYDRAIADFLGAGRSITVALEKDRDLRYGENPDQPAALYRAVDRKPYGLSALEQHHGKELSYNNYLDLEGALLALSPFALSERTAVVIVKHTTPCGLAVGDDVASAYEAALRTDPVSAFGSVIATNRFVDVDAARAISELFVECLVAPGFEAEALELLSQKKNVRLLTIPESASPALGPAAGLGHLGEDAQRAARFLCAMSDPQSPSWRSIYGAVVSQASASPPFLGADLEWRVVTERAPTPDEERDLRFAWAAVFAVKSNAILFAKDGATLGIGAGQMSRVDSSKLAVRKARDAGLSLQGSALASDAFFPFRDGVDAAAAAGVSAIVEPGGSRRDPEVIAAANEHGVAMVFTGRRLFRH